MPLFQPSVIKFLKQKTIKEGVDLMNDGRIDEALLEFSRARSEVSNDPIMMAAIVFYETNAHRLLAEKHLMDRDLAKAEDHARAAVQANPEFADMCNLLGRTLLEQGRFEEALVQFEKALDKNESFIDALVNKSCALAKLQMVAQTRRALELAKKYSRGRCLNSHYDLAFKYLKEKDFDLAYEEIRKAFDLSASVASSYLAKGIAEAEAGGWEEAYQSFMKALENEPRFADVHNQLGIVCSERQQFEEAIQHFKSALAINPHFVAARLNLGFALSRSGHHFQALEELKYVVTQSMGGPSGVADMIARISRSAAS